MTDSVQTSGDISGTAYEYVEQISDMLLATQVHTTIAPWLFYNHPGQLEYRGGVYHIRLEPEVAIGSGEDINVANNTNAKVTDINERHATLEKLEQRHAAFKGLSNLEKTLSIDPARFAQWIKTVGVNMSIAMDRDLWDVYAAGAGLTFGARDQIISFGHFELASGILHEVPLPADNQKLVAVMSPSAFSIAKKAFGGPVVQNDAKGSGGGITFGDEMLQPIMLDGAFRGKIFGYIDCYVSGNIPRYVAGKWANSAAPKINGASQTGDTLETDGWNAASAAGANDGAYLNAGAAFKIAGVNFVDMKNKDFIMPATFTVRERTYADENGNMTIKISPELNAGDYAYTSGRTNNLTTNLYNNCDSAPADNAVITMFGNSEEVLQQAFLFNEMGPYRSGIDLDPVYIDANSPHEKVKSVSFGDNGEGGMGFSMACLVYIDGDKRQTTLRFDALQAASVIRPMYCARIIGSNKQQLLSTIA